MGLSRRPILGRILWHSPRPALDQLAVGSNNDTVVSLELARPSFQYPIRAESAGDIGLAFMDRHPSNTGSRGRLQLELDFANIGELIPVYRRVVDPLSLDQTAAWKDEDRAVREPREDCDQSDRGRDCREYQNGIVGESANQSTAPPDGIADQRRSALEFFEENARGDASRHVPPYPKTEGRRTKGSRPRDGLVQDLKRLVMRRLLSISIAVVIVAESLVVRKNNAWYQEDDGESFQFGLLREMTR